MAKKIENLNLFGVSYNSLIEKNTANKVIISASKTAIKNYYGSLNELSRGFLDVAKTDRNTALLLLDALKIKCASFNAQNISKELEKVTHKQVLKMFKDNFQKNTDNQAVKKVWDIPKKMYHFEIVELFTIANVYTAINNARNGVELAKVETGVHYTAKGEILTKTKAEQIEKDWKAEQEKATKQAEFIQNKKDALYNEYIQSVADSKETTNTEN